MLNSAYRKVWVSNTLLSAMTFDEIVPWVILGLAVIGILVFGVYAQVAATLKLWPFQVKKAPEQLDK